MDQNEFVVKNRCFCKSYLRITLLLSFGIFALDALAGNIVIEGRYQKKNIFVVNANAADGVGFCIYQITVNSLVTSDDVNTQAFEIDLSLYKFKVGDPVTVIIKHKDGCVPRVLNPGALEPSPSFECQRIECSRSGNLTWETIHEEGKIPFTIQQYKWNKWVSVGEVMGNGTPAKNSYNFQVQLTSGSNRFRVVQKSFDGDLRKSQNCDIQSDVEPVAMRYDKKSRKISFTAETNFELYNSFGQIVKRGRGIEVECLSLPKGDYFISYDCKTDKITRK